MSDTLHENVTKLIDQYNGMLVEHDIEITIHRRSFKEEVEAYNYQSQHSFFNML